MVVCFAIPMQPVGTLQWRKRVVSRFVDSLSSASVGWMFEETCVMLGASSFGLSLFFFLYFRDVLVEYQYPMHTALRVYFPQNIIF